MNRFTKFEATTRQNKMINILESIREEIGLARRNSEDGINPAAPKRAPLLPLGPENPNFPAGYFNFKL